MKSNQSASQDLPGRLHNQQEPRSCTSGENSWTWRDPALVADERTEWIRGSEEELQWWWHYPNSLLWIFSFLFEWLNVSSFSWGWNPRSSVLNVVFLRPVAVHVFEPFLPFSPVYLSSMISIDLPSWFPNHQVSLLRSLCFFTTCPHHHECLPLLYLLANSEISSLAKCLTNAMLW